MDEYSALAQRVAMTMDDVRGCLLLSRDGLVLGAFPEDGEAALKPSWLKFIAVGDARRSFVEFGDQIWAYIHRGAYAAFVVAGASVRPGILLDQLEQALLVAEEARQKRDTLKVPDAAGAPSGKPRTSLHPPADRPSVDVAAGAPAEPDAAGVGAPPGATQAPDPVAASAEATVSAESVTEVDPTGPAPFGSNPFTEFADGVVEPEEESAAEALTEASAADPATDAAPPSGKEPGKASSFPKKPQKLAGDADETADQPGEIDRVMLAKEFSGLLQLDVDTDEDSS
jgi:hypothetical protein